MVKSADEAAKNYRTGVEMFGGADQYEKCGDKSGEGFLAVAKCLHDAKKAKMTTDSMVEKYRKAA